ncbi:Protein nedd1 [Podila epicladia]|nr:Protein nedd1 [Podila epicladia]KAG0095662.1 Protein nedd1 [Podila epicladia]
MEASQPPPRLAGQRKRSYSTTAYSSQEDSLLAASEPSLPTCLLATAVGTQVMTYEFIKQGTEPIPPSKSTTVSPGQYEGTLMSNERTTYGAISSLKWSPDNTILAVEAQDGRIIVYNNKGKVQEALVSEPVLESMDTNSRAVQTSRTGSNRCAISWSPKPQRLYYANGYSISAWDSASKRTTECFEIMAKLEYSVFNKSLLGTAGNDGILRLWDTGSNGSSSVFHSFSATHSVPISGMAFSPFNKYLVCTTGLDGRYSLYDVEQKTVVKNTLTEYPLTSIAFKSDGVSMAFGTDQGKILLYDLRSTSRPISVVDTRVNAPVSAIHFQGKPSSASKHATNGHTLKRQNSAGGKITSYIVKEADSIGGGIALISGSSLASTLTSNTVVTESAASQPYKSIFSKPTAIRTNTLSNSSLNLLSLAGSGSKPSRDTLAAGSVNKSTSMFPTSRPTDQDSEKAVSFKPQRPPPPTSIATKTAQANATGTTAGSMSATTPTTRPHTAPTTPIKEKSNFEQPISHQGSYPNSRTASPYSFQIMQSRSPSGSPSSVSSVNHTPPGSPAYGSGTKQLGGSSFSLTSQSHLQHHHYSTNSDPLSGAVSPSVSRAKRRKSFGKLVAPGGIGPSSLAVTDPLSNERMEIISGQIADRVRNVLLNHPDPALGGHVDGSARTDLSSGGKQASSSGKGTMPTSLSQPTPLPSTASQQQPLTDTYSRAPSRPKDLWMQVGSEGTSPKHSGPLSSTSVVVDSWSREAPSTDTASSGQGEQGGLMLSSFSSKVLENVIEGCLMEFRTGIRNDIQNMHLELLRQFQIQKLEIEALLREYSDTRELRDEIERLQEENRQLKTNY